MGVCMIPPCPDGRAVQSFFLCVCKCQPQIPAGSLKCPCVQGTLLGGFIGCWSHWYLHWERWMTLQRSLGPSCFNLIPRTHGYPCHLGPCHGLKMGLLPYSLKVQLQWQISDTVEEKVLGVSKRKMKVLWTKCLSGIMVVCLHERDISPCSGMVVWLFSECSNGIWKNSTQNNLLATLAIKQGCTSIWPP